MGRFRWGNSAIESLNAEIDAVETLLLEDLVLQEAFQGEELAARRSQIRQAYVRIREYLEARVAYLRSVLE